MITNNQDFAIIKVGIAGTVTNADGLVFPECGAVDCWDAQSDAPQYDACANLASRWLEGWGFVCTEHAEALFEIADVNAI
jgi:hypothetical protein